MTVAAESTSAGAQQIEAICRDLACPQCSYNLRGLSGQQVTCPECGTSCDVAKLVAGRWTGNWYQAPGLKQVMFPVAWAYLAPVLGLLILTAFEVAEMFDASVAYAVMLPIFGMWLWLLWRLRRLFGGRWEGPALGLLAHLLLAGYFFGAMMLLGAFINTVGFLSAGGDWNVGILAVLTVVLGLAAIWGARHGEKFIARRCIRQYLRKQSQV